MIESDNIVPELNTSLVHPTTSGRKTTKRSSKSVRTRKREARRVTLNKSCAERIQKSFHINTIVIDGVDCDFADAFAFMDWYQENLARLEDVPKHLVFKFREQYLALNPTEDEDEFLRDIIRHKFLFEDCAYEKFANSDSDESVFDEVHKSETDVFDDEAFGLDPPRIDSPGCKYASLVYCDSTDYSGLSNDEFDTKCEGASTSTACDGGVHGEDVQLGEFPQEVPVIEVEMREPVDSHKTVLYEDLGGRRLCAQMTECDFKDIDNRKFELLRNRANTNVKVRYDNVTLFMKVDRLICYHLPNDIPIVSTDSRTWDVRDGIYLSTPQIVARQNELINNVISVVVMG